jgi:hypothetical protein
MYLGLGLLTAGVAGVGELIRPGGGTDALAWEALGLVAAAHLSVLMLWRTRRARGRRDELLEERYSVARRDALITTIVGALAVRRLTEVPVPAELITIGLLVALLAVPVYALRYLLWFWRGEFDRH